MYSRKTRMLLAALCLYVLPKAQPAGRFSVMIDEIFPDPTPRIGLPNSEYLELVNASTDTVNLLNWSISDGNSTAVIRSSFFLKPDSFVILCPSSAIASFLSFGPAIGVTSFPSLNNDGDRLFLRSPEGILIHAVQYSDNWYGNEVKKQGGWSLEMMDPKNPCTGAGNWIASNSPAGGTPGTKNSVARSNPDESPPALIRSYTLDSLTLVAVFDEPLDSLHAAIPDHYRLGGKEPISASPLPPLFNEIVIQLRERLAPDSVYDLQVTDIRDCTGNPIGMFNRVKAGLPVIPGSNDIVINEILFNPPPGGYDYVELYNRGRSAVDLKSIYLANRNSTGGLSNLVALNDSSWLMFPGEFLVLTENKTWLLRHFSVPYSDRVMEISSLPSLPDDRGVLVLTSVQGNIIDELDYRESWHFPLIANPEGVALERIDYSQPSAQPDNWTSAAATSGYGTPGYQNSQFRMDPSFEGTFEGRPAIFSPDNDGYDDFTEFRYRFTQPGFVGSLTLFDAWGKPVRRLAQNAILGKEGIFRWNGLDDNNRALPMGKYIALLEIFNTKGKTKNFKTLITLARKF